MVTARFFSRQHQAALLQRDLEVRVGLERGPQEPPELRGHPGGSRSNASAIGSKAMCLNNWSRDRQSQR